MYPIGYVLNRDFGLGPSSEEGLEDPSAHFSVKAAYTVDVGTSSHGQKSHEKGAVLVFRVYPT